MLNLSLAAVFDAGERARWEVPPDDPLWAGAELTLRGPVRIEAEAAPIGGSGVLVRVTLRAGIEAPCRRCTARTRVEVDEPLELLFEPLQAGEAEELEGEVYPLPARGDALDLSGAIREQLLLSLPDHVLCDEACRGLCAQCGADLNRQACDCRREPQPSAWDALKNIRFD